MRAIRKRPAGAGSSSGSGALAQRRGARRDAARRAPRARRRARRAPRPSGGRRRRGAPARPRGRPARRRRSPPSAAPRRPSGANAKPPTATSPAPGGPSRRVGHGAAGQLAPGARRPRRSGPGPAAVEPPHDAERRERGAAAVGLLEAEPVLARRAARRTRRRSGRPRRRRATVSADEHLVAARGARGGTARSQRRAQLARSAAASSGERVAGGPVPDAHAPPASPRTPPQYGLRGLGEGEVPGRPSSIDAARRAARPAAIRARGGRPACARSCSPAIASTGMLGSSRSAGSACSSPQSPSPQRAGRRGRRRRVNAGRAAPRTPSGVADEERHLVEPQLPRHVVATRRLALERGPDLRRQALEGRLAARRAPAPRRRRCTRSRSALPGKSTRCCIAT